MATGSYAYGPFGDEIDASYGDPGLDACDGGSVDFGQPAAASGPSEDSIDLSAKPELEVRDPRRTLHDFDCLGLLHGVEQLGRTVDAVR